MNDPFHYVRSIRASGMVAASLAIVASSSLVACGPECIEVTDPYYLSYFENLADMQLFRCSPNSGCAGDGLPGPAIFRAGADRNYIVVARHPRKDGVTDKSRTEYLYVVRHVYERAEAHRSDGEGVVGPLAEREFNEAKVRLHLPDFSVNVE